MAPGVVRVAADHGYGTVDVGVSSAGSSGTGWVVFEILNTSSWHGDPFQKHINFGCLCPADMCPGGQYPTGGTASTQGRTTGSGKFQGFRGQEDGDSSGWFTISSEWQTWTKMLFVQPGWKLAYALARAQAFLFFV